MTMPTTATTSFDSDPEESKVIAALKHHRRLELILSKDVGPRHEQGLATDGDLQDACSEIAASEKDLFELAKLLLEFDPQAIDEVYPPNEKMVNDPPRSKGGNLHESKAEARPQSKANKLPAESNSSRGPGPKATASGFDKRDWRDFKTSEGILDWDELKAFHKATPSGREKGCDPVHSQSRECAGH